MAFSKSNWSSWSSDFTFTCQERRQMNQPCCQLGCLQKTSANCSHEDLARHDSRFATNWNMTLRFCRASAADLVHVIVVVNQPCLMRRKGAQGWKCRRPPFLHFMRLILAQAPPRNPACDIIQILADRRETWTCIVSQKYRPVSHTATIALSTTFLGRCWNIGHVLGT